jgi:hypothetical protein
MFVGAIRAMPTMPCLEHVLAVLRVPEPALLSMRALAVAIFVAWWFAFFSVWGSARGARIGLAFALGLALAFALALVSAISIAVQRVARGGAGAAGAAPS